MKKGSVVPDSCRRSGRFKCLLQKHDQEIKVYRLEKAPAEPGAGAPAAVAEEGMPCSADLPPSHPPIGNMAAAASSRTAAVPSAAVPANWEPQALSEMRKASYIVHGADGTSADISFVALGAVLRVMFSIT